MGLLSAARVPGGDPETRPGQDDLTLVDAAHGPEVLLADRVGLATLAAMWWLLAASLTAVEDDHAHDILVPVEGDLHPGKTTDVAGQVASRLVGPPLRLSRLARLPPRLCLGLSRLVGRLETALLFSCDLLEDLEILLVHPAVPVQVLGLATPQPFSRFGQNLGGGLRPGREGAGRSKEPG